MKSFRRSPPPSPPTSSSNPESPSSSSTYSSSTQTPHTPPGQPHTLPVFMAFWPTIQARYVALVLPNNLDAFPNGYLKYLPKYNGETGPSAEDHLQAFLDFANNMNIEQENVYMRLFVQSLEGNVRIWFMQLPAVSIRNLEELTTIFKIEWGVKKDPLYFLIEFE